MELLLPTLLLLLPLLIDAFRLKISSAVMSRFVGINKRIPYPYQYVCIYYGDVGAQVGNQLQQIWNVGGGRVITNTQGGIPVDENIKWDVNLKGKDLYLATYMQDESVFSVTDGAADFYSTLIVDEIDPKTGKVNKAKSGVGQPFAIFFIPNSNHEEEADIIHEEVMQWPPRIVDLKLDLPIHQAGIQYKVHLYWREKLGPKLFIYKRFDDFTTATANKTGLIPLKHNTDRWDLFGVTFIPTKSRKGKQLAVTFPEMLQRLEPAKEGEPDHRFKAIEYHQQRGRGASLSAVITTIGSFIPSGGGGGGGAKKDEALPPQVFQVFTIQRTILPQGAHHQNDVPLDVRGNLTWNLLVER